MSGHSKWNNIKNTKAKSDAQKSKIYTKIGREIAVAVKAGGTDPEINNKLADVILKARQNNMPNDTIMRSIKKAGGEGSGDNYEEVIYEGYGPGGSAVIVQCLTDNKNRTAGDVRHLFDKYGAGLGTTNSVAYMFSRKGVFVVSSEISEDEMFEKIIEIGADDFKKEDETYIIYSSLENFHAVKTAIQQESSLKIESASIDYVPNIEMELLPENEEKFETLIEMLEELDDVQEVYYNVK
jgi:YebC/PmpR family DNA-binding regulatory protein